MQPSEQHLDTVQQLQRRSEQQPTEQQLAADEQLEGRAEDTASRHETIALFGSVGARVRAFFRSSCLRAV